AAQIPAPDVALTARWGRGSHDVDPSPEITDVLGDHLGGADRRARGVGFLRLLAPFGLGRADSPGRDDEVIALLYLIGGGTSDLPALERKLTEALSEARRLN